MSAAGDGRPGFDDIDRLVDRAISALARFARKGSALTTGVAIVAAFVAGLAYLVGLAAFDGGARTVWSVVGAAIVVGAVGAPLLASFRLRSLPRQSAQLASELRTLLQRDDDARRVVETVSWEDEGAAARPSLGGRPMPAVVWQSQHYTTLRGLAGRTGDVKNLAAAFQRVASLPALVSLGLVLTGLSAFCGFVFLLIWIF